MFNLLICVSLRKDIFDHKGISCFSLFNNGNIFFMINIYSDDDQAALKYLKDTKANLHNMLVMAEDFNIREIENGILLIHST